MTWLVALGLLTLYAVGLWLAYRVGVLRGADIATPSPASADWFTCGPW